MIIIPSHKAIPQRGPFNTNAGPSKFILNYVIEYEHPLGKGNFSSVYQCTKNSEPFKKYAVKLLNIANLRQNKLDHLLLMSINDPNVITCKDVFWGDTWCYIFCDYFERNLEQQIRKVKKFNQNVESHAIIRNIFAGLVYLEKSKIIHRDIKPANIFLKDSRAVVADLGFAKYFNEPFYDVQIGSPPYMAPQSLSKGYYSHKSDVWAFGVLLYQLFHGEGPYTRCKDMAELVQRVSTPILRSRLRLDLSIEMKQLILNCLEVDIDKRPKLSQIQESWYFRKLFEGKNIHHLSPQRAPLNIINLCPNLRMMRSTEKTRNNPIFNRINKLKGEIKRKKDENIAPLTYFEKTTTPQKIQTSQREQHIKFEKDYFSNMKQSMAANTEDNEEESVVSENSSMSHVYFNDFIDENSYHASKFSSKQNNARPISTRNSDQKFKLLKVRGSNKLLESGSSAGKSTGWRQKMKINQSPVIRQFLKS